LNVAPSMLIHSPSEGVIVLAGIWLTPNQGLDNHSQVLLDLNYYFAHDFWIWKGFSINIIILKLFWVAFLNFGGMSKLIFLCFTIPILNIHCAVFYQSMQLSKHSPSLSRNTIPDLGVYKHQGSTTCHFKSQWSCNRIWSDHEYLEYIASTNISAASLSWFLSGYRSSS